MLQTKRDSGGATSARPHPQHPDPRFVLLLAACALPAGSLPAADPWWQTYTPVATLDQRGTGLETIQPGAARGGSGTLGWYGFWFLDEQDKSGVLQASRQKLQQAGVKRLLYYDLGEVGDYAGHEFGQIERCPHAPADTLSAS